jgi:Leucine-rich repeat (LRR) protein
MLPLPHAKDIGYMYFGHKFNGPLNELPNCNNIKMINFGNSFNQPLDPLKELPNLEIIGLSDNFKHSLIPLIECNNLKTIYMNKTHAAAFYIPSVLINKIEVNESLEEAWESQLKLILSPQFC